MTAKLYYSHSLNPRVAVAAARYLHAPVEYVRASPRHPDNIEAFRAINPNALVPVLVEGEARLWETDAIVCRLSEDQLERLSPDPGGGPALFLPDRLAHLVRRDTRPGGAGQGASGLPDPCGDAGRAPGGPDLGSGR
jgi:glutathione S-transferase